MVAFSIASPEAFDSLDDQPVGSGPFKFKEWKRNDAIYLTKNEDYWREGYPKVAQLIYKTIPDNTARINSIVAGEIDLADGLSPNDGPRLEQEDSVLLVERPSFNVGYFGMTLTQKPFDDIKVREAVSYAIDREEIVESYFGGRAILAKNPLQPTAIGYYEDTKPYEYNPEKAKSLLAESSYDGSVVALWAMPIPRPYMPDGAKVAEVIQKYLEEIGMKTKIVTYEWATYLEKTGNLFIKSHQNYEESKAVLYGMPMDWTVSYRPGQRFGPARIREVSIGLEEYSFYLDRELGEVPFFDAGDIPLPFGNAEKSLAEIKNFVRQVVADGKIPIGMGGEHLVSLPVMEAVYEKYEDLAVIHFDAHTDLRTDYEGEPYSHATPIRKIADKIGPHNVYSFGIRSGLKEELQWAKEHG